MATATGTTGTLFRYGEGPVHLQLEHEEHQRQQAGNYEVRVYTDAAITNLLGSQSIELKR